jgi:hypothetical protein
VGGVSGQCMWIVASRSFAGRGLELGSRADGGGAARSGAARRLLARRAPRATQSRPRPFAAPTPPPSHPPTLPPAPPAPPPRPACATPRPVGRACSEARVPARLRGVQEAAAGGQQRGAAPRSGRSASSGRARRVGAACRRRGMGKRKSAAKPPPKAAAPKLDTQFNCPFCNSTKTVRRRWRARARGAPPSPRRAACCPALATPRPARPRANHRTPRAPPPPPCPPLAGAVPDGLGGADRHRRVRRVPRELEQQDQPPDRADRHLLGCVWTWGWVGVVGWGRWVEPARSSGVPCRVSAHARLPPARAPAPRAPTPRLAGRLRERQLLRRRGRRLCTHHCAAAPAPRIPPLLLCRQLFVPVPLPPPNVIPKTQTPGPGLRMSETRGAHRQAGCALERTRRAAAPAPAARRRQQPKQTTPGQKRGGLRSVEEWRC